MTIDLSFVINSDLGVPIKVDQPVSSGWVDGEWVDDHIFSYRCLAVVRSPSLDDLKMLPEGERPVDVMMFTANKPIQVGNDLDGLKPSTITYLGRKYKAFGHVDWLAYGHNTVAGVRFE